MAGLIQPLLATMSKGARTAWPFIERGVREGMGANAIQQALREAGAGIRRQDLLALVREATGAELLRSDLARLPRDLLVPFNRVRESVSKIVAPFSYTLEAIAVDPLTGRERKVMLTAHSEQLEAMEDVESTFLESVDEEYPLRGETLVSARVIDVVRSGPLGVI